jgi:hypothetical protein
MKYQDYKNLILKLCWKFKKKNTQIDFNDLLSEANLVFTICSKKFDETKNVKFSTYIYSCVENGLKTFIRDEKIRMKRYKSICFENIVKKEKESHSLHYRCNFSFFELDKNCHDVINFIHNFPEELRGDSGKITKKNLRAIMHSQINFQHKEIDYIFNEIRDSII